jgi:hypothetical protein
LAASAIRSEKWRYNYGRKVTPIRLAKVKLPQSASLQRYVSSLYDRFGDVVAASLRPYETEDETDTQVARGRLKQIDTEATALVSGAELDEKLEELTA